MSWQFHNKAKYLASPANMLSPYIITNSRSHGAEVQVSVIIMTPPQKKIMTFVDYERKINIPPATFMNITIFFQ